ncbi:UNVERIFIED_CONTAM: hypothetical protein Sradi_3013100 [Sesamum radiatum]|uniref:Uncharacterized protein n=1 Tax=Sesamum radiatum TaxID=300843 RepID=A0AAW2S168_SESRA
MDLGVQINGKVVMAMLDTEPIQGEAFVDMKVGTWTGKRNSMVISLDDFDMVLGIDFMLLAHAMDFVRSVEKKDNLMLGTQVKNSLKHGEQTYLAALIEIKPDVVQEVPNEVVEFLEEFKGVLPPELPNKLAPRAIDHAIELNLGHGLRYRPLTACLRRS